MRLLEMAWDDRRRTFRAPVVDSRLSAPQIYFRWTLSVLGIGLVLVVVAFLALVISAT